MSFIIKKLHNSEVSRSRQLIHLWLDEDNSKNQTVPDHDYLNTLLKRDDFHVYVAINNDKVVGGLTAYEIKMFYRHETEMFLYEIGVNKNHRRRGIAKSLIEELKKTCLNKGIKVIFVGTSMDNDAARKLYESTGGIEEVSSWYNYNLGSK